MMAATNLRAGQTDLDIPGRDSSPGFDDLIPEQL